MATLIECTGGARLAYREILAHTLNGLMRSPRGLATYDAGHVTMSFRDVHDMLAIGVGRELSTKIAAMEALQLVAGLSVDELMLKVAPQFRRYARPNGTFWGAYGRRIGDQLNRVYDKLLTDPETRQAVITLWDPDLDNRPGEADYPCTVALGFSVTPSGALNMHTTMRSNDAWLGLPYDVFQFTQLQCSLANALCRPPGNYVYTAWSLHLYEENRSAAMHVVTDARLRALPAIPAIMHFGVGRWGDSIRVIRDRAAMILTGREIDDMTETEEWYVEQLADHVKR